MKKNLGILGALIVVVAYASASEPDKFLTWYNLSNVLQRASLYAILGIGVSFVIMSGGIDLSIGSMIGLVACVAPLSLAELTKYDISSETAITLVLITVLALTVLIGLSHGLLVTKLRLQPFIVTLCGLLLYRGVARFIAGGKTLGARGFGVFELLGAKMELPLLGEDFKIPRSFFILLGVGILAAIFLNRTIFGRYLLAIGRNEQAARFSGINTHRITILCYILCAVISGGLGGMLFLFDIKSVAAHNFGESYELYAIAAAVMGGCNLRGGEGSILGVMLGAALITVISNAGNVLGFPDALELATIGSVILAGAIVDEVVKRIAAARRKRKQEL